MSSITEWRNSFRKMLTDMQVHDAEGIVARNKKIRMSLTNFLTDRPGLWLSYFGGQDDPAVDVKIPGIQFAYPRVDIEESTLEFYVSSSPNSELDSDRYFLPEPNINDSSWKKIPRESCFNQSVRGILLPGLGFDRSFYRLGRGSGFYERYLLGCPILKIGITFSEQVVAALPGADSDIRVDVIISDQEIIWNPKISKK